MKDMDCTYKTEEGKLYPGRLLDFKAIWTEDGETQNIVAIICCNMTNQLVDVPLSQVYVPEPKR